MDVFIVKEVEGKPYIYGVKITKTNNIGSVYSRPFDIDELSQDINLYCVVVKKLHSGPKGAYVLNIQGPWTYEPPFYGFPSKEEFVTSFMLSHGENVPVNVNTHPQDMLGNSGYDYITTIDFPLNTSLNYLPNMGQAILFREDVYVEYRIYGTQCVTLRLMSDLANFQTFKLM